MATSLTVLAVEDEDNDAFLLRTALQKAGVPNPLAVVHDGQEAVDYLSGNSPFEDRAAHPLPGLVLLDLKMPRMTGFDVLAWMATRPEFQNLPVIILSSSSDVSDIRKAREMGARDYYEKPHDFSRLIAIARDLNSRWLEAHN
jgi:CheY-like chemotaxis protein